MRRFPKLPLQFAHFFLAELILSISALIRPRVNRFYTTVEKFPDIRLDIIRQELLNTGIYYQGDFDVSYMKMRWLHFDGHPRSKQQREYTDLHDYENFRFDTTHFLYLPLNFKWINIVPRAGFKFTTYGATSKQKVSTNDLLMMFSAANPQSMSEWESVSYDRDGGGKIRVVGELGVEVSTKIHNTWNDVRSRFLGLDGLRHIIRPYMNYTYISSPNVKPENLMYFDDIDRIDSQNFFRFGLENRLQTRSGGGVRDYFSMENFWDLYLTKEDGFANVKRFGNIGNVGTIVTWTPIERLTLSSSILISLTDENGPLPDVIRKGRNVGKVGLGVKWIDRWNISLSYRPIDDVTLYLRYTYQRPYSARSSYSIGSTLTQIDGGGYFNKYFGSHTEILSFGAALPLTPDRRTRGTFDCSYDVMEGGFSNISFSLVRTFHCWELIGTLGFEADDDASSGWDTQFSIQARLIGLEAPLQNRANSVLSEMDSFSTNSPSKRLF